MILLDPDLEAGTRSSTKLALWSDRIPTPRTLARFLAEAQATVRLRGEVTVLLTTDRKIRQLNRDFRGKNKATDVLSFPADEFIRKQEGIVGDLAVSIDTARKQAAQQDHALTCELKVLMLHGLLHLAGYDHETDSGQMARKERLLRAKLRLPLGLIERTETPKTKTTTGPSTPAARAASAQDDSARGRAAGGRRKAADRTSVRSRKP